MSDMIWDKTKEIFNTERTEIRLEDITETHYARLAINIEETIFETCLLPAKTKKLFVILTALNSRLSYPKFSRQRWSMFLDAYCLYIDDPTRNEHSLRFHPCFYFGTDKKDYCEFILKIIRKIASLHSIPIDNIYLIGSSNAGFACIKIACLLEGAKCIALCPQISIKTFFEGNHKLFEKEFNVNLDNRDLLYRTTLLPLLKENKRSKIVIYSNIKSSNDRNQMNLLCRAFEKNLEEGFLQITNLLSLVITNIDAPDPHVAQPGISFIKYLLHYIDSNTHDNSIINSFIEDLKFKYLVEKNLMLEAFWKNILNKFLEYLPDSIIPQINLTKIYQQFTIKNLPRYIHYEFLYLNKSLFFCIHYEHTYTDIIKKHLEHIAKKIDAKFILTPQKILLNKKIPIDYTLTFESARDIIHNTLNDVVKLHQDTDHILQTTQETQDYPFLPTKQYLHGLAIELTEKCKEYYYDEKVVNIYCIQKDGSISLESAIPGVQCVDSDKADGSIIIYHSGSQFTDCKFSLRKKCSIIIMPTRYKINKLTIINRDGFGSLCYLGNNFSCNGAEFRLWENKNIYIGNDVMFSWNIKLFTSDGHTIFNNSDDVINPPDDIVINDHVWIGFDVKILKGSFINKNCVVGASSLISKKYAIENSVLSGIPAKILHTNISWKRDKFCKFKNNGIYNV